MKKIISFLLTLVMLMLGVVSVAAADSSDERITTKDGFMYYLNADGTATICGSPSNKTEVVFPKKVDGHKVTVIGTYRQQFSANPEVTSITVPEGVETIQPLVIWSFKNVVNISYPSSLKSIGNSDQYRQTAFYQDESNWDNGMLYIGTNLIAVNDAPNGVLKLHDDTTCIARYPLHAIIDATEFIIPGSIPHNLKEVVPKTIKTITIPAALKDIPAEFCMNANQLETVIIENGVESIGEKAFFDCESLKHVAIPESVNSIGEKALGYITQNFYYTSLVPDFTLYCGDNQAAIAYAQSNGITISAQPGSSTEDEIMLGDANTDGDVNIKDATAIQKHIAVLDVLNDEALRVADFNKDSEVNIKDATDIQKFIAKIK